jgi:hypothetical protein
VVLYFTDRFYCTLQFQAGILLCLGGRKVSKHHIEYKEEEEKGVVLVKVAVVFESRHSFLLFAISRQTAQRFLKSPTPFEKRNVLYLKNVVVYKTPDIPLSKTTEI